MKTVTVKKVRHLCGERGPEHWSDTTAEEGVRVLVDGVNVLGDDSDFFNSFRNADYESTDGYAVVHLLKALDAHGVLKLECDDDVVRAYGLDKPAESK